MPTLRDLEAPEEILREIDDAWLGIDIPESEIFNPLEDLKPSDVKFHLKLTWMLTNPDYFSFLCNVVLGLDILPSQGLMLKEMWNRKFPMLIASRGFGKSFILSVYAILRALILPNRKVVIVGAAFRQSKVLFDYMETLWNNCPILQSMCDKNSGPRRSNDQHVLRINNSTITCLPLGDGTKIRGQRANDIIADEFASIPRDIFETVVAGFGVVKAVPVDNVKKMAAIKRARELGYVIEEEEQDVDRAKDNQVILSGTAYYDFNHFAQYWKDWCRIIKSCGDPKKLAEFFGEREVPPGFSWDQYSVIRVPYELLPEGFMDAAHVARSKATVHAGIYQMEYGAVFTRDSMGFFKRLLLESCVSNEEDPIKDFEDKPIIFNASLLGRRKKEHVFGIDPASEVDNFSIVILELNPDHRRIVYSWTITRSEHREKIKSGETKETEFYSFCARKIRDLMKRFPCVHISMDAGGGGIAVEEALHDKDKLEPGEQPIWPVVDEDDPKDTDDQKGLHIIEMVQFSRADWVAEANHGMRKDFEDKVLLFPMSDAVLMSLAQVQDEMKGRRYDTLDECVLEIEELKDELAMIEVTQTPSGRERWDTPEVIIGAGKKERLRKDRYSALLMANMAARERDRALPAMQLQYYGGFATVDTAKASGQMYSGPAWFTEDSYNNGSFY